jgi:hypothetical protein
MIDTPKNLTRNILVGLILGFVVGAFLFYTNFFPSSVDAFVEKYIFKMGGDIFHESPKVIGCAFGFLFFGNRAFPLSEAHSL